MVRSIKKAGQNTEQHTALTTQLELEAFGDVSSSKEGQLSEPEVWWRQHFGWLKDHGYLLRPRYSPDWKPSWIGTKKKKFACEDGRVAKVCCLQLSVVEISFMVFLVCKSCTRCHTYLGRQICCTQVGEKIRPPF